MEIRLGVGCKGFLQKHFIKMKLKLKKGRMRVFVRRQKGSFLLGWLAIDIRGWMRREWIVEEAGRQDFN